MTLKSVGAMEFEMRTFKKDEFELTLRMFAKENEFYVDTTSYICLGDNTTIELSDYIIGKLTKKQLTELKAIK